MNAKTYSTVMRIVAAALGAFIAVSIFLELPLYVPLIGVMLALLAATISRRLVKEVIADERNRRIDEKAASISYRIYTLFTAAVVLITMMLRSGLPDWVGIASQTLAYSLCGLMLVHLVSTKYYSSRL
jgi:uncharacterized membrane protein